LDDEQSVIARAKSDPEQFGILFERHYPSIFAYINRRVADWDVSNDLGPLIFVFSRRKMEAGISAAPRAAGCAARRSTESRISPLQTAASSGA